LFFVETPSSRVARSFKALAIASVGLVGVFLNFWADKQREWFREADGKLCKGNSLQTLAVVSGNWELAQRHRGGVYTNCSISQQFAYTQKKRSTTVIFLCFLGLNPVVVYAESVCGKCVGVCGV